jgi:hypothetical protein
MSRSSLVLLLGGPARRLACLLPASLRLLENKQRSACY